MQRERRRDPYPWTWEIPLVVTLASGFAVVIGLQLGRSLANLVAGAGWTWPDPNAGQFTSPIGAAFWTSLPGVVSGDAGAGLSESTLDADADQLAGPGLLWACLGITEVLLIAAMSWAAIYVLQRWGPGRMRGMATATEAERLLGVTRLRKVAGIVRPDLHGKHANPGEKGRSTSRARRAAGVAPAGPADPTGPQLGRGLSPWLLEGRSSKTPTTSVRRSDARGDRP